MYSYLKSVLRYKYLILDTCHPDTIYMSKDVRIRCYFSKPRRVSKQKVWKTLLESMFAFSQIFPLRTERAHIIFGNTQPCVLIDAVHNSLVVRQMLELCVQQPALSAPSSFAFYCIRFFFSFILCQIISAVGTSC